MDGATQSAIEIRKQGAIFSPEGVMMLMIFGTLDVIDFFIGSVLVVDIIAALVYFAWVYFRSQVTAVMEGEERRTEALAQAKEKIKEKVEAGKERRMARAKRREKPTAKKGASIAKKGKWLRRVLLVVEFIPIVGMIPGWIIMVYSELKS